MVANASLITESRLATPISLAAGVIAAELTALFIWAALLAKGDAEQARVKLERAQKLDPKDAAIKAELVKCVPPSRDGLPSLGRPHQTRGKRPSRASPLSCSERHAPLSSPLASPGSDRLPTDLGPACDRLRLPTDPRLAIWRAPSG